MIMFSGPKIVSKSQVLDDSQTATGVPKALVHVTGKPTLTEYGTSISWRPQNQMEILDSVRSVTNLNHRSTVRVYVDLQGLNAPSSSDRVERRAVRVSTSPLNSTTLVIVIQVAAVG
jgi:hypothetical protein